VPTRKYKGFTDNFCKPFLSLCPKCGHFFSKPYFHIELDTTFWYHSIMKRKHQKTLELIFTRPTSGNVKWVDIESLFISLGAEISEREGSRIGVKLFGERLVFHRPHPSPDTDKGAVSSIREWLKRNGIKP